MASDERQGRAFDGAETLADIVHYMRQEVPDAPGAQIPKRRVREILMMYADRIEAAALREARNCDVGHYEDQIYRWDAFCRGRERRGEPPIHCLEWAQMPLGQWREAKDGK